MLLYAGTWLCLVFAAGCVTQTERIYPHERLAEEGSAWDELRREFTGHPDDTNTTIKQRPSEPFYKRAAKGVKETVSGWFQEDVTRLSPQEIDANRRRFERRREEALQRLKEQQEE